MLGAWLNKAKQMLPGESDSKLAEWNARTQITNWGKDNPKTILHEYAQKEWNGLLSDFYLPRWLAFFDWAEAKLDGNAKPFSDFFEM